MSSAPPVVHADAETIAALAEGRIDPGKLDAALVHVETCRSCMDELLLAGAVASHESVAPRARRVYAWWGAAAAAVVVIAVSVPVLVRRMTGPAEMARLVAAVPRGHRLAAPRL